MFLNSLLKIDLHSILGCTGSLSTRVKRESLQNADSKLTVPPFFNWLLAVGIGLAHAGVERRTQGESEKLDPFQSRMSVKGSKPTVLKDTSALSPRTSNRRFALGLLRAFGGAILFSFPPHDDGDVVAGSPVPNQTPYSSATALRHFVSRLFHKRSWHQKCCKCIMAFPASFSNGVLSCSIANMLSRQPCASAEWSSDWQP